VKATGIFALAAGALLMAAACARNIGDDCQTSVDCDPNGTRLCDLSQPGGYCTIAGCDQTSCPKSSTCVRVFPEQYLTPSASATNPPNHCISACEDLACLPAGSCDQAAGNCCPDACPQGPTNDCNAEELCLRVDATGMNDVCVRRALEQRYCAKSCSSNSDCRDGYECRATGTGGTLVLATNPDASTAFCAPLVSGP
jgi:hypothetical protein